jgi:hypothetical protein
MRNWFAGINLHNTDHDYTIENTTITQIGTSGIVLNRAAPDPAPPDPVGQRRVRIVGNSITYTGLAGEHTSASYTHAIYSNWLETEIVGNTFANNTDNISLRYGGALVESNDITGGSNGVAWFPYDTTHTRYTTRIAYNRIHDPRVTGIYIDNSAPQTVEDFELLSNTIEMSNADGSGTSPIAVAGTTGSVLVANNIGTGRHDYNMVVYQAPGSFTERNNLWFSGGGPERWRYGTAFPTTLADWQSASGQGSADVTGDPDLGSDFTLAAGSPAIDAGISSVAGVVYVVGCTGGLFTYCGAAVDLGAVEHSP